MGALYGNQCFLSQSDAADAFFTASAPALTSGATSYLSWFQKSGTVWQIRRQSIASNGTVTTLTTSNATSPTFPTCDEMANFKDGVAWGSGVLVAMVVAFVFRSMRRAL